MIFPLRIYFVHCVYICAMNSFRKINLTNNVYIQTLNMYNLIISNRQIMSHLMKNTYSLQIYILNSI